MIFIVRVIYSCYFILLYFNILLYFIIFKYEFLMLDYKCTKWKCASFV